MQTRHLAIMLTDIKGFTSKTASFSRAETLDLLKRHKELVLPVVEKYRGRLVKTIGDAFLVVFESPTDSVLCGVEIQGVLKEHNTDKAQDERIEIRIAINSGEVAIEEDGDIYGDAVNITSRLESIAEAGEVFFTESVYLAMNKKEVPSSEIGYRQFKGIPEKIKVFRVLREIPVGAGSPDMPVSAASLAQPGPAAAAQAALPEHPPKLPERAGFWRRFSALMLDVAIVLIVLNTFGLQSCGPHGRWNIKERRGAEETEIKDVNISANGVTIKGGGGQTIRLNKDGIEKTGGKIRREERRDFGFDTGLGEEDKKYVPLKMLLWALYSGIFLWRFAVTPGMRIMKLKLVEFPAGGPVPADKAFLRAFFSLVSCFAALGYIWAVWEKDRRTWHDIIAGTRVIKL